MMKKIKKEYMSYLTVYPDIFQKIGEFLDSDDLFSMALTCKSAYRAFRRPDIQSRISWPLLKPKRLTLDQRQVIKDMEKIDMIVKLVSGSVGSGKSIVSLAYCLRNNFDKIVIVVPPNLVSMWTKTCVDFFGLIPLVLHNSNSKYNFRTEINRIEPPEEKIIIISYIIFSRTPLHWIGNNDACIIDEAHHSLHSYGRNFRETIALSATAFRKDTLSYGIRSLYQHHDVDFDSISFNLDKGVISSKLPKIYHLPPHVWKIKNDIVDYILRKKTRPIEGENDLRDIKWISEVLTHPFIIDDMFLGGSLTIGKKTFNIPKGNETEFLPYEQAFHIENPREGFAPWSKTVNKKYREFREDFASVNIEKVMKQNIKYRQCLSICEYLKKTGEKGIIFDINVTYLPFLHKFLIDRGIRSYIFSTHYDVASRQKQLEKFKEDRNAQVLLSSIAMLGEGHNVTEPNHAIFLSTFLEANKYYQAIGRMHRYPQDKKVYVHYLFNSQMDQKIFEHSKSEVNLSKLNWELLLKS